VKVSKKLRPEVNGSDKDWIGGVAEDGVTEEDVGREGTVNDVEIWTYDSGKSLTLRMWCSISSSRHRSRRFHSKSS